MFEALARSGGALGLTAMFAKAYVPRTNTKAEKLIKMLLAEWACSMACRRPEQRYSWLPGYLASPNGSGCRMVLMGRIPSQQFGFIMAKERLGEKIVFKPVPSWVAGLEASCWQLTASKLRSPAVAARC